MLSARQLVTSEALSPFPIRLAVESTDTIPPESLNRVGFDPIDVSENALPDTLYMYDPATGEYIEFAEKVREKIENN